MKLEELIAPCPKCGSKVEEIVEEVVDEMQEVVEDVFEE